METPRPDDQRMESTTFATGEEPDAERSAVGNQSRSHDAIAKRAYRRFEERGREPGRDLDDWLEAERELSSSLEE